MQNQSLTTCYIGLGANLGKPVEQIESALKCLAETPSIHDLKSSSFYGSKPMGPQDQPDYVNAVATFTTSQTAISLLDTLQRIEEEHHRQRDVRWGARTLDLDILLYGNEFIETPRLTVPHSGIFVREFVLYPLAELKPDLVFPNGEQLSDIIKLVPLNGLMTIKTPPF